MRGFSCIPQANACLSNSVNSRRNVAASQLRLTIAATLQMVNLGSWNSRLTWDKTTLQILSTDKGPKSSWGVRNRDCRLLKHLIQCPSNKIFLSCIYWLIGAFLTCYQFIIKITNNHIIFVIKNSARNIFLYLMFLRPVEQL